MKWFNRQSNETPDESFERREAIVTSVLGTFKKLDNISCEGKDFILWIDVNDTIFNDLLSMSNGITLEHELTDRLIKKGYDIRKLEFREGKPNGNPTPCIKDNRINFTMYLEKVVPTSTATNHSVILKARITLAQGSPGALKQPEGYEIDSEHAPYNIGRVIELGDTTNRINHIEIVDDTFTVSRTQAHIGFSTVFGFYVQREKGGLIRTKVIRKNDSTSEHKLASELVMFPLFDGDVIELNDYVRLLFQIIN